MMPSTDAKPAAKHTRWPHATALSAGHLETWVTRAAAPGRSAAQDVSAGAHPQREVNAGNLVALPEVTDVARHPALRAFLVASLERFDQAPVSGGDACARLRHLVDHDAQRRLEQLQQRLLSQSQHRVVSRLPEAAEHLRAAMHRLLGIAAAGDERRRGGRDA